MLLSSMVSYGQIGISSPGYGGDDADIFNSNWGAICNVGGPIPLSLMFMKDTTLPKPFIVIYPSIRIEWLNFKDNFIVERRDGKTSFTPDSDITHVYKNGFLRTTSMMKTTSFFLPIEFWFWSKKRPNLILSPGLYVNVVLGGRFINKYTSSNTKEKEITKFKSNPDFFGFNRFQFGPCAQIHYRFISIYGSYSLLPVFKKDQGINITQYSLGINFRFLSNSYIPGYY